MLYSTDDIHMSIDISMRFHATFIVSEWANESFVLFEKIQIDWNCTHEL